MSGDPRTDVTRLLDDLERQASGDVHDRLIAAVRAGLALADKLAGPPTVAENAALRRAIADRIRAALTAPLAGQPTTDEEER